MDAPTAFRFVVAFVAVLLLAGCSNGDDGAGSDAAPTFPPPPTSSEPVTMTGGPFITSNRDHMAFCASDLSGRSLSADDADRIAAAIEAVIERVGEDRWPADRTLYSLTEGCPEPAAPLGEGTLDGETASGYAVETDQPSFYRVFIYLVPSEVYEATFGDSPYTRAAAELFCADGSCSEVTTALYVPDGIGNDALADAVFAAAGIVVD